MDKLYFIPVALIVLLVGSMVASAQMFGPSNDATDKRVVSVSGSYVMSVSPDKAEFSISVETLKPTAKEAIEANREISNKVIAALKAAGVDPKEIQTQNFYVYKKEEYLPYPEDPAVNTKPSYPVSGRTQTVGWVATNTIRVVTKNLDKVGSYIDAASEAGATGFNGVTFGLTTAKQGELESELLKGAAANAKTKATALAEALGARVGKVMVISESYPVIYAANQKNLAFDAVQSAGAPTPIEPGKLDTSISVSVSFELI